MKRYNLSQGKGSNFVIDKLYSVSYISILITVPLKVMSTIHIRCNIDLIYYDIMAGYINHRRHS